jgi:hypothetical protein
MPNIDVPKSDNPNLARAASRISMDAGIYSSMGGGSSISQMHDPVGLMNWFRQPYSSGSSIVAGDSAASAQYSVNQQILSNSFSSDPLLSSVYDSLGTVQNPNSSANWASIIHEHPNLSQVMANASVDMTIVSRLDTYA